jgi:5-methylthioadenosine/S-adenosylhomocysteine deaminase
MSRCHAEFLGRRTLGALLGALLALSAAGCAVLPGPLGARRAAEIAAAGFDEEDNDPFQPAGELLQLEDTNVTPYVLLGRLLLPDGRTPEGGLLVEDGIIQELFEGDVPADVAAVPGVRVVSTRGGLILPGLIDLHNHVPYNVLPFWQAPRLYDTRGQWQRAAEYDAAVKTPYDALKAAGLLDEMIKWGEIRALIGGTTSILGAPDRTAAGILVRNIDHVTLGSDKMRTYVLDVEDFGRSDQAAEIAKLKQQFAEGLDAMVFHIAEGRDPAMRSEFAFLEQQDLLRKEVVVTHGTALEAADFQKMASRDMPLVWSPRSNLALYGVTTDVAAAKAAGVRIALAPDWSPSGSDNLLGELRFTSALNQSSLNGLFSARELVDMATRVPAAIAGRAGLLGELRPTARADLLVLADCGEDDPFVCVVTSDERDVRLVTVNGVALYGWRSLLTALGKEGDFEVIEVRGRERAIDTDVDPSFQWPKGDQSFVTLHDALDAALADFGGLPSPTANGP